MLPADRLLIAHTTSTYPCKPEELNLRMIATLAGDVRLPDRLLGPRGRAADDRRRRGARRHASWSATSRSIARCGAATRPRRSSRAGCARLVRDIRVIEDAMGDGVKRVYESEIPVRDRLRRSGSGAITGTRSARATTRRAGRRGGRPGGTSACAARVEEQRQSRATGRRRSARTSAPADCAGTPAPRTPGRGAGRRARTGSTGGGWHASMARRRRRRRRPGR